MRSLLNKHLFLAFITYEKAFDSLEISAVMEALHGHEIAEAYVNTLGNISRDFAAAVILCKESVKIKIRKGVG